LIGRPVSELNEQSDEDLLMEYVSQWRLLSVVKCQILNAYVCLQRRVLRPNHAKDFCTGFTSINRQFVSITNKGISTSQNEFNYNPCRSNKTSTNLSKDNIEFLLFSRKRFILNIRYKTCEIQISQIRRGADKFMAFLISYFPICSTTKRIFLGWVKEVRTTKS
jgi:hypothetical protein